MADDISQRTKVLIGEDGVEALRDSYVVLAGVGAVGGYALEGLVRAGVGHIKVIDADVFNDTNLNRQIIATVKTIGQPKAIVAIERARSINPDIDISAEMEFVSEDTLPSLLSKKPDVLVDAIDTIQHKVSLLRYAATHDIVTYSSMGAALHMDAEKIRIANIMGTKVCPLASSIRCKLRDVDTKHITCVYSEEKPIHVDMDRDEHGKSILGSLPTIPAIFGMILANEAIKHIIGSKD